jgi:hypothetical protein
MLREKHLFTLFESRVLRKIFGPKRDEVSGEWRRLHNEELYGIYSSLNMYLGDKIRNNEMSGACSSIEDRKDEYMGLVGDLRERAT